MHKKLHVREVTLEDIAFIVDYWMHSTDKHLIGMGVDLEKLPNKIDLTNALTQAIVSKQSFVVIWEFEQEPIGHSNVNNIVIGKDAFMHIHLWKNNMRQKGLGLAFIKKSLPFYFNTLKLETIYCEPYALNPAPNKALKKIGFELVKKYMTIPGSINFEQEVNRWKMSREKFKTIT